MTVGQAKEAAKLVERLKNLDKALDCIKIPEETRLPSYCSLEIGSMYFRVKADGIPREIALETMEHLKNNLEAEKFVVATKLEKM